MYRIRGSRPEVFLVHLGGPFWKNKDDGAWDIPKGEIEEGESDLLEAAKREFKEETGFKPEGDFQYLSSTKGSGKIVEVWAFEGDLDPTKVKSNTVFIDWPPKSGKKMEIPEVDRAGFFTVEEAKNKVFKYHSATIEAFENFFKAK